MKKNLKIMLSMVSIASIITPSLISSKCDKKDKVDTSLEDNLKSITADVLNKENKLATSIKSISDITFSNYDKNKFEVVEATFSYETKNVVTLTFKLKDKQTNKVSQSKTINISGFMATTLDFWKTKALVEWNNAYSDIVKQLPNIVANYDLKDETKTRLLTSQKSIYGKLKNDKEIYKVLEAWILNLNKKDVQEDGGLLHDINNIIPTIYEKVKELLEKLNLSNDLNELVFKNINNMISTLVTSTINKLPKILKIKETNPDFSIEQIMEEYAKQNPKDDFMGSIKNLLMGDNFIYKFLSGISKNIIKNPKIAQIDNIQAKTNKFLETFKDLSSIFDKELEEYKKIAGNSIFNFNIINFFTNLTNKILELQNKNLSEAFLDKEDRAAFKEAWDKEMQKFVDFGSSLIKQLVPIALKTYQVFNEIASEGMTIDKAKKQFENGYKNYYKNLPLLLKQKGLNDKLIGLLTKKEQLVTREILTERKLKSKVWNSYNSPFEAIEKLTTDLKLNKETKEFILSAMVQISNISYYAFIDLIISHAKLRQDNPTLSAEELLKLKKPLDSTFIKQIEEYKDIISQVLSKFTDELVNLTITQDDIKDIANIDEIVKPLKNFYNNFYDEFAKIINNHKAELEDLAKNPLNVTKVLKTIADDWEKRRNEVISSLKFANETDKNKFISAYKIKTDLLKEFFSPTGPLLSAAMNIYSSQNIFISKINKLDLK
ncbi:hypothetical protein [Metamycoplasma buccale]|uniref:hypothetical protein n=1 Tax=Metamycoplasma buccale TaxID=55602 RepID=UPI00398E4C5A